jgi:hypothetical protein
LRTGRWLRFSTRSPPLGDAQTTALARVAIAEFDDFRYTYERVAETLYWFFKHVGDVGQLQRIQRLRITDKSEERDGRRLFESFLERKLLGIAADPTPLLELKLDGWEGQLSSEAKHLAALHLQSLDAHFGFDLDWVDCLKKRSTPIRRLDISDENPSFYRIEWANIPQPPVPFGLCGFAKYPPAKHSRHLDQGE